MDAAATTPVKPEVLRAMWPYLSEDFGNPSSRHALGEIAARALADARARVAAVLGCRSKEVMFTSGGTEGDNIAVKGIALANPRGRHIVTTATEHEAVLASCDYLARHHGFEITYVQVDQYGTLQPELFEHALRSDTSLCTVMLANNEVGTIQPVQELAMIARSRRIPFHTDAVQAAGALEVNVEALGVDALSLSGHKIGAPKGIGALFLRRRVDVEPVIHGGGQEYGRRSGTENVAAAVAFATALELSAASREGRAARLRELRDRLITGVLQDVPGAILTGHPTNRLPGHASFCFAGTSGEAVLLALEERGILCSSGSACAAGSDEPSHVLVAIGVPRELAQTAVRFSFGDDITDQQIDTVIRAAHDAVSTLTALHSNARVI
ncbi:MAG TPA: cysteine desulfurase family protein [Acidobacteriaceae bacterium]|jgi:cysteine desulfurase|nr:cysteine desulfurase family protein [Acidobacteriaceae bacterium]